MAKFAIMGVLTLAAAGFGLYVLFPKAFRPSEDGVGRKRWGYLFGIVLLAEFLLFAVAPLLNWWLPKGISTYSWDIDLLFYVILGLTGVTFFAVGAVMVYILFKYTKEEGRPSLYSHGSHKLEMIWTGVPAVLLIFLAVGQIPAWLKVKATGAQVGEGDFHQVEVTGRQWEWRIRYAGSAHMNEWQDSTAVRKDFRLKLPARPDDVRKVNELHLIKGRKTVVHLKTQDVIHSFFLPHVRLKQDALPGKTAPVWFQINEANTMRIVDKTSEAKPPTTDMVWTMMKDDKGEPIKDPSGLFQWVRWEDGYDLATKKKSHDHIWEIACAEFCGSRHSLMKGRVFVHEDEADYKLWLKSAELLQKQTVAN